MPLDNPHNMHSQSHPLSFESNTIWTKTIEIASEERSPSRLRCPGETDGSILTVDHIILASEYSPDQHFVFATCLSFATSAFPKTPIDVASCTIAMEDGIVRMSALDGDAHWLLWTSCQVSELTLDSSDAKYEVGQRADRFEVGVCFLSGGRCSSSSAGCSIAPALNVDSDIVDHFSHTLLARNIASI
ncbi:hypothetical protein BLNAU_21073 [Blattamonas nauphoetae]|uniref:Uncharacterized protein n=1 Tax=Blattamonas nauphoetae TaxID=2049346 RepID=A0ABQ9WWV5_9EUKA|nr:hypothetical protein BLNAU_21073 [Blattamonas nauphoetae]